MKQYIFIFLSLLLLCPLDAEAYLVRFSDFYIEVDSNGTGWGPYYETPNNTTERSNIFSGNQTNIEHTIKKMLNNDSNISQLKDMPPEDLNKMMGNITQMNENLKTEIQNVTHDLKNEIESQFNSNIDVANNYINNHNADINNIIASLPYLDPNQSEKNIKSASPKVKQTAAYSSFVGRVVRPENQFLKDAADRALSSADALATSGNMDESDKEAQHASQLLDNAISPNVVPPKDWKSTGEARKSLMDLQAKIAKIRPLTNTQAIGQQLGLAAIDEADEAAASADDERTKKNYELAKASLDIALGFVPVLNVGQSLYEAVTGKSVMTGEDIGKFGQVMAILGVATLGGHSVIKSSLSTFGKIAEAALKVASEASRNSFREAFGLSSKFVESAAKLFDKTGLSNFFDIIKNETGALAPFGGDVSKAIEKIKYPSIWSEGKFKDSVKNAFKHFNDHGKEFPEVNNALEYVEKAHEFMKNPPTGTLTKTRLNGEKVFYHQSTETFAVQGVDGAPKTMFKPNPEIHKYPTNLEYFNAQ